MKFVSVASAVVRNSQHINCLLLCQRQRRFHRRANAAIERIDSNVIVLNVLLSDLGRSLQKVCDLPLSPRNCKSLLLRPCSPLQLQPIAPGTHSDEKSAPIGAVEAAALKFTYLIFCPQHIKRAIKDVHCLNKVS